MTEMRVMTLSDFLLARIAEDEASAPSVPTDIQWRPWGSNESWRDGQPDFAVTAEVRHAGAKPDPRVLAECAAKRRIVEEFAARDEDTDLMLGASTLRQREWGGLRIAVRNLAAVYADHPDYRPEWKP